MNGWVKKNLAAVLAMLVLVGGFVGQTAVLHYKVSENQKDIKEIKTTVKEINHRMDWIFKEAE